MSAVLRKPMRRLDRFLGSQVESLANLGDLSLRFYTIKPRKMAEQYIMHIRVRVSKDKPIYSLVYPIRSRFETLMLLKECIIYEEKCYNYLDLKIRLPQ